MARWWENDRGPDKIVEGPYSKGEITAIASSKKGKPVSISRCPEEAPTVAVLEIWAYQELEEGVNGNSHLPYLYTFISLYF